eukprot:CAMPEP_0179987468 /NCGR_PEP_ID=MMETSP0984-20121128/2793_1 /TAXON_ID=483367 /ORGANISM="non described non described, Strain CCMP 2436" /LENGTH=62 /DNA_ID=CAMNT_0021906345 /DNA_START=83 /DNA_END=269 /DNA_ORIENTATION=+
MPLDGVHAERQGSASHAAADEEVQARWGGAAADLAAPRPGRARMPRGVLPGRAVESPCAARR